MQVFSMQRDGSKENGRDKYRDIVNDAWKCQKVCVDRKKENQKSPSAFSPLGQGLTYPDSEYELKLLKMSAIWNITICKAIKIKHDAWKWQKVWREKDGKPERSLYVTPSGHELNCLNKNYKLTQMV
jgi:hypothetical protein